MCGQESPGVPTLLRVRNDIPDLPRSARRAGERQQHHCENDPRESQPAHRTLLDWSMTPFATETRTLAVLARRRRGLSGSAEASQPASRCGRSEERRVGKGGRWREATAGEVEKGTESE